MNRCKIEAEIGNDELMQLYVDDECICDVEKRFCCSGYVMRPALKMSSVFSIFRDEAYELYPDVENQYISYLDYLVVKCKEIQREEKKGDFLGMHNLYGKRKLNVFEIKGSFELSNGMFCLWGVSPEEGVSVDIYDDSSKKLLIGLEHHIRVSDPDNVDEELLRTLIESFIDELEDSMVYYYGERTCTFKESDIIEPIPKKTGRFAH